MSQKRTWTEPLFTCLLMRTIGYEAWGRPESHPPPYWASPSERTSLARKATALRSS
jgi:hypothetical protein